MNDGFPNDSYTVSTNELCLYIDQAIAYNIVGKTWEAAKITGVMEVPEAFLVTYLLTLSQDLISGYWTAPLPQPPVGLPLGYSINRVYPASQAMGQGLDFLPIKSKRVGYRTLLPMPPGGRYWVENNTLWLAANNNAYLGNVGFYVQMPTSRTSDITQNMNLPDDVIQILFDSVTAELTKRFQNPKDVIKDNLPAGSTNVNTPKT